MHCICWHICLSWWSTCFSTRLELRWTLREGDGERDCICRTTTMSPLRDPVSQTGEIWSWIQYRCLCQGTSLVNLAIPLNFHDWRSMIPWCTIFPNNSTLHNSGQTNTNNTSQKIPPTIQAHKMQSNNGRFSLNYLKFILRYWSLLCHSASLRENPILSHAFINRNARKIFGLLYLYLFIWILIY